MSWKDNVRIALNRFILQIEIILEYINWKLFKKISNNAHWKNPVTESQIRLELPEALWVGDI